MAEEQSAPINFDFDSITIGDLEDFEEATGKPLMSIFEGGNGDNLDLDLTKLDAKTIKAFIWIARRHQEDDLELDDVRDMKLSDLGIGGSSDPS